MCLLMHSEAEWRIPRQREQAITSWAVVKKGKEKLMAYHFEIKNPQQRQFVEQITEKAEEYFANAGIVSPVNKGMDIKVTVSSRMTKTLGQTILIHNRRTNVCESIEVRLSKELFDINSIGAGSHVMAHELIHVLYPTQGHGPLFKRICKRINEANKGVEISVQWQGQGATLEEIFKLAEIHEAKRQKRLERKLQRERATMEQAWA